MSEASAPLRVAVVGARRRRQGLGYHLARFAAEAGAEIVGIVGTSEETLAEASRTLDALGLEPRPYLDVDDLLVAEEPDILIVASPHATHEACLERALARRVHALCEKPLCWGGRDPAGRAHALAQAFVAAGLHLGVNAQWPYTLDAWRRLFPGVLDRNPHRFHMRLSPISRKAAMLPDALPHALSLLQAVLPSDPPHVEDARIEQLDAVGDRLRVTFVFVAGEARVEARVDLTRGGAQPREAGYGFDDQYARRRVDLDGYHLFLEGDGREVPLPDPTPRLVHAFLGRVSSAEVPVVDPNAWPGMALLAQLDAAWARLEDAS